MISKKGGNAPRATDLDYKWYVVEKKQILRKPLYCTWELNTYSTEQTTDSLCVSVTRGSGGKNVIFSKCPYDQSKYSDPLIYISI